MLDVVGALEDLAQFGIPDIALDWIFAGVPVSSEHEQCIVSHMRGHVRGEELRLRGLADETVTSVPQLGRVQIEEPAGVDHHRHVSELELNGLEVEDGLAKLASLLCIQERG